MNTNSNTNSNDASRGDGFGCDSFAEELSLFVFGELQEVDRERLAALESHLVGCAACRGERDALVRSLEILKLDGAGDPSAPQLSAARQANLLAQAQAQAQTLSAPRGRILAFSRFAIAAGLVAAAGAGWYMWDLNQSKRCEEDAIGIASLDASARRGAIAPADATTMSQQVDFAGPKITGIPLPETIDRNALPVELPTAAAPAGDPNGSVNLLQDGDKNLGDPMALSEVPLQPDPSGHFGVPTAPFGGGEQKVEEAVPLTPPTSPTPLTDSLSSLAGPGAPPAEGHISNGQPSVSAGRRAGGGSSAHGAGVRSGTGAKKKKPDASSASTKPADLVARTESDGFQDNEEGATSEELQDSLDESLARLDGRSRRLNALGYAAEDGAEVVQLPADPALIGQLLAAACSPAQVLRIQSQLAAMLGVDPTQPPRPGLDKDRDVVVREFLDRLSRRQNEPPRDMFFRYFGDHPFVPTRIDAKSTFGMDVDTASYALARAYLTRGTLPPKTSVRTEEFVNAFKHDLAPPDAERRSDGGRDVFAIHTELAPSPFGDEGQYLLQIGLKARVIPKNARKPVALTFVVDVSGSMEQDGRLELVKQGLRMLVNQLDERDTVGLVTFESNGHRILAPTNAADRARIFAALDPLRPMGSTNADEGLRLGYAMALEQLKPGAENRVILCSDGVANTGVTDPKWLSARIAECKSKYIYLNCVGVGMGNHNDALMEQLADEGDGFCAYMDRVEEAKKIFVDRLTGTLLTVARNAKIQVEFDPVGVRRFRQLGYENRALAHRDFRNDKVDAGEVGAGQEVVALYEIEPNPGAVGPLATVRVRYEDPDLGQVREQARAVFAAETRDTVQKTSARFRLSACVAEFAELLRQSVHARDGSLGAVERLAEPLVDELKSDPDVPEFVALVKQAARLPDLIPPRNELVRAVDELKKLRCWREELRDVPDARDAADQQLMRQLEEQNRRLEQQLRDALDRALRHS